MIRNTLLLLLLVGVHTSWGQQAPATGAVRGQDALQAFFSSPDIVLPRLYEAAIAHSGEIERLNAGKAVAEEDVKIAKKRILSIVGLSTSYTYGSLPYFSSANDAGSPRYVYNPFGLGARAQFVGGFVVSAPLDILASRQASIRRQELIVDQTVAQRKTTETALHQQVILQYQALVLARAVQLTAQESMQSASISKKIADKRFKDGDIQVDEQMAAQDLYSRAMLAQEEARNRYQTAQLLLEDLIGTSINNIMLGK